MPHTKFKKVCELCGKKFSGIQLARYCSIDCRDKAALNRKKEQRAKAEKKPKQTFSLVCSRCQAHYEAFKPTSLYCSRSCRSATRYERHKDYYTEIRKTKFKPKEKQDLTCLVCKQGYKGHGNGKYCSPECKRMAVNLDLQPKKPKKYLTRCNF